MSIPAALRQVWASIITSNNFNSTLKKEVSCSPKKMLISLEHDDSLLRVAGAHPTSPQQHNALGVELVSACNGKCTAEMLVAEEHSNALGSLHGGLTSTLVDVISGLALATDGKSKIGVSVDLHITFLNPALIGEKIVIEAKTIKSGRTLAFLDVVITSKTSGKIIATGSHTKFVA